MSDVPKSKSKSKNGSFFLESFKSTMVVRTSWSIKRLTDFPADSKRGQRSFKILCLDFFDGGKDRKART